MLDRVQFLFWFQTCGCRPVDEAVNPTSGKKRSGVVLRALDRVGDGRLLVEVPRCRQLGVIWGFTEDVVKFPAKSSCRRACTILLQT